MERIIPKKTKVKNTVWRAWGIVDVFVALVLFVIVFVLLSTGCYAWFAITLLITVGLMIPTQDGIVYMILWGMVKYLISPKEHARGAQGKRSVSAVFPLKAITKSGVVKYEDGSFARVIHVGQKNFSLLSEDAQNADIELFAQALKCLNLNQSADLVRVERAVDLDRFTKSLDRDIARAEDLPDGGTKSTRLEILRDRKECLEEVSCQRQRYLSEFYIVIYGKNRADLEGTALSVSSGVQRCGLVTTILDGAETAAFLKNTFTRDFDPKEAEGKTSRELVEWVTPKKITFNAHGAVVDGLSQSVVAVSDYPLTVGNAWGAKIFDTEATKVVLHIRPVEQSKAIKRIDKCVSDSEVKSETAYKASEANSAETHMATMMTLLDKIQKSDELLLDATICVTAYSYGDDDTQAQRLKVKQRLTENGFRSSNLYAMQRQGFMLSCPAPYEKFRNYDRGINSSSLAAVFPFVRAYLADDDGIMLGFTRKGAYPFILNLWKRGPMYQNSNAMIIGKSGSGKSFFMKSFLTGEWSEGTRIIILDPENEYDHLTKNLGGSLIDVGDAREGRINPFHIYRILTDEGTPAAPAVTFNTHLKTLESFYRVVLEGITPDILELINNLTIEAYAARGIVEATDCSDFAPDMFPTFSDLMKVIEEKEAMRPDELTLRELRTARMYLQKFVTGRYSDIWNGPSTMNIDSGMVNFNFQSLFANKNNIVANAQMLLVFRYIEQEVINGRERTRGGEDLRTLIIVDEAHMFIDAKYPVALDFFYTMCKRIRKYNGAFVPATQSISDWTGDSLKDRTRAIVDNSQYMFVFKLSAPDMDQLQKVFRAGGGFNKTEQSAIVNYATGSAFFIGSSEFRTDLIVRTSKTVVKLFEEKKKPSETR